MRLTHRIVPGLLAGSLVLGTGTAAFAARSAHAKVSGRAAAYGQVSALSNGNFTLTFTPKKAGATPRAWQIATTGTTKELALKGTTGPLANNEYAFVVGTSPSKGNINATNIRYSTTDFLGKAGKLRKALGSTIIGAAHATSGVLSTGSTFTVTVSHKDKATGTTTSKDFTFTVTDKTRFKSGREAASTTGIALTAGEKILVHYRVNGTNSSELDAVLVAVAVPHLNAKGLGRGVAGAAVDAGTLSVGNTFQVTATHTNKKTGTTTSKTFTFTVTSSTLFRASKTAPSSTPLTLTAGEKVLVRFKPNATNANELDATLVSVAA